MPIPVVSLAQMREWEKATWEAGRTQEGVIRRVGHLAAQRVLQLTRTGDLIVVMAGKGHNGDDSRQTSQHLTDREIYLINVQDPAAALDEFRFQLSLSPALIIDGIFGIGLNRPLGPEWVRLIDEINRAGLPVLAVDIPSGLNAETGEPQGAAVRATTTITLAAPKIGLLSPKAWPYVGRLEVLPDIGLVPCPLKSEIQWTLPHDFSEFPHMRRAHTHKGSYGHLAILAGSVGYHGAAALAARGAARARPGLVSVFTAPQVYVPVASRLEQQMVHPWQPGTQLPDGTTAVLCGPGLAGPDVPAELKEFVGRLWLEFDKPVVVDASALAWLPAGKETKALRVITPHPGEAGQMLGVSAAVVQEDRPGSVRQLSRKFGNCWVVLKGHQTLIGSNNGKLFVNPSGNPYLAQGGSGDVLSGFIAGWLAQPELQTEPLMALRYAVFQHGAAADFLSTSSRNWVLEELIQQLGAVNSTAV